MAKIDVAEDLVPVGEYRVTYRVEPKRLLVLTVIEGHRRLRGLPGK